MERVPETADGGAGSALEALLRATRAVTAGGHVGEAAPPAMEEVVLALCLAGRSRGRPCPGARASGLCRTAYDLLLAAAACPDPRGALAADLVAAYPAPRRGGARSTLRRCVARGLLTVRRRSGGRGARPRFTLSPRGHALLARAVRDDVHSLRGGPAAPRRTAAGGRGGRPLDSGSAPWAR